MTLKNRIFLDALKRENNQEYVPVWLLRQAGRYLPEYMKIRSQYSDFFQMNKKPEVCKELTLQPLQRYPLDAAITSLIFLQFQMLWECLLSLFQAKDQYLEIQFVMIMLLN